MKALFTLLLTFNSFASMAQENIVAKTSSSHHIRSGTEREWSTFPVDCENRELQWQFDAKENTSEYCLCLSQEDVKEFWDIKLNDVEIGKLVRDENPIRGYWAIPSGTLHDGINTLTISTRTQNSDDIRISNLTLLSNSMADALNESRLSVLVHDKDTGKETPCRITVIQEEQLLTTGATSDDNMAVRPGVIYCKGRAEFGVPSGKLRIVAGRGPEYSIDEVNITLEPGDHQQIQLSIHREVDTSGFVSCDTHVHTFTHSGHGDATIRERMLTIAGEGIELPIATDHNKHIDYTTIARSMQLSEHFTPVIGNEVTTRHGHFNIFPVASSETPIPDFKGDSWNDVFDSIFATPNVRVSILNHARDVHSGYRPFGTSSHLSLTGRNLDGWKLRANAMEVLNSAAQQSDVMTLVHDWMNMLNAGKKLTPVGCSDSHDVSRHFVGQGRTLIQSEATTAGQINVAQTVDNFLAGKVIVSCGLSANMQLNEAHSIGETAPQSSSYSLRVSAMGPSWIEADTIEVYLNGQLYRTHTIEKQRQRKPGTKDTFELQLPGSTNQDYFIVAVVRGPGVTELFWPIAKPYQPTTQQWTPTCLAVTGTINVDADGDGNFTPASQYARQLCEAVGYDVPQVIAGLKQYDAAVGVHAAQALHEKLGDNFMPTALSAARQQNGVVKKSFSDYYDAWQQAQRARVEE